MKVAYYLKKGKAKRITRKQWREDKKSDGWIKGYITKVNYFDGIYISFDKPPAKKRKRRKQPNSSQLTLENQYLSWDILKTTRTNSILRRLRQTDDDDEETESEWERDDGLQENVDDDDEENQHADRDYDQDEDGNIQYY